MRQDCCVRTPQAHLDPFPCAKRTTAAFLRREHTWISFRAQTDMFMRQQCCIRTSPLHLDLAPFAKKHVPAKRLLRSHAGSTLRSLSVRKKTCSCDNNAAFARCEHTGVPLRAPRDMFWQSDYRSVRKETCSIEMTAAFSRRAHTWISPCAKHTEIFATTLLRSHTTSTHGFLSVRKEICCGKTTAAFSRRLDLAPCAKRHVPSKKLLRFRAAPQNR